MAEDAVVWEKRYGEGVVRVHQVGDEKEQRISMLRLQDTLSRITGADCTVTINETPNAQAR